MSYWAIGKVSCRSWRLCRIQNESIELGRSISNSQIETWKWEWRPCGSDLEDYQVGCRMCHLHSGSCGRSFANYAKCPLNSKWLKIQHFASPFCGRNGIDSYDNMEYNFLFENIERLRSSLSTRRSDFCVCVGCWNRRFREFFGNNNFEIFHPRAEMLWRNLSISNFSQNYFHLG